GLGLLDGVHGKAADRIGHTGMIDLRHDENPPEMRWLVAIRGMRMPRLLTRRQREASGWIASRFRESKAMETRLRCEKLLSGA
ncbi:MAG: hypothetical protein Q7U92_17635, partial [Bradyrhizobium sp.]|nr:hypothetical protein [Bradyrhizobium sp.]